MAFLVVNIAFLVASWSPGRLLHPGLQLVATYPEQPVAAPCFDRWLAAPSPPGQLLAAPCFQTSSAVWPSPGLQVVQCFDTLLVAPWSDMVVVGSHLPERPQAAPGFDIMLAKLVA